MKECKDCKEHNCSRRSFDEKAKCYYEENYWMKYRDLAAKDIMCAMINHFGTSNLDVKEVSKLADNLVFELKKNR